MKFTLTLANSLSLFRLIIAPVTVWNIISGWWLAASFLLILAILSDLLDGPIARKKGQESSTGGLLDHSCDAFLVAVLLFVLTKTLSFLQYVFDSKALTGQRLRTSFLGRSNGICYFVLASLCIFTEALEINLPDYFIVNFAWILITSTLLSMSERLWTLVTK